MVGQGKGRIDTAEANQAREQHQLRIVVVPDAVENLYDLGVHHARLTARHYDILNRFISAFPGCDPRPRKPQSGSAQP